MGFAANSIFSLENTLRKQNFEKNKYFSRKWFRLPTAIDVYNYFTFVRRRPPRQPINRTVFRERGPCGHMPEGGSTKELKIISKISFKFVMKKKTYFIKYIRFRIFQNVP